MSIMILIFAERSFERIEARLTTALAHAYSDGVTAGSDLYGAGSCGAYVMPDDEDDMREFERPDQIERAMVAMADIEEREHHDRVGDRDGGES